MPSITFATVIKLLIASLIVGMALAYLELSPEDILAWVQGHVGDILANTTDYAQWALKYVLLGAVVVVPIWLINYAWRAARRKS